MIKKKGNEVRECSKSRVAVRDLELHDTVYLAGSDVSKHDGVFSLHHMGESDTLFGEIVDAFESRLPGKIRIRVNTKKSDYLLDVSRSDEFLTIEPKEISAVDLSIRSKILLRGDAAPELLGGKQLHTDLVQTHGAVAEVRKVKALRNGDVRVTVLLGAKRKFTFTVDPETILEVL